MGIIKKNNGYMTFMKDFPDHIKKVSVSIKELLRYYCEIESLKTDSSLIMLAIECCKMLYKRGILKGASSLFDLSKYFHEKFNLLVNWIEVVVSIQGLFNEIKYSQHVLTYDDIDLYQRYINCEKKRMNACCLI